ncbi:MAG: ATPase [Bacteroidetes bacterium]|nr:ATPase [Bacteroidota bacterium]
MISWHQIKEKINLAIYDSKEKVLFWMRIGSLAASVAAIGTLIYYYGFPTTPEIRRPLLVIIQFSFVFYIFHYALRVLYDFNPRAYIKDTWFEALMMVLILIEGINYNFYGVLIIQKIFFAFGIPYIEHLTAIFIQVYLLVTVGIQLGTPASILPNIKFQPHTIFILSFFFLITAGTLLLLLPEMTNIEGSMPLIDALFMSASATCVTGLQTVDTATYFTFKGQFVLMILMQLGGLNIISFGIFFAIFLHLGVGVRQEMLDTYVGSDSILKSRGILRQILLTCLFIEMAGTCLLYMAWPENISFTTNGQRFFFSLFHSIAAFNNGGLSVFSGNLYDPLVRNAYPVHIVIAALIFMGALGIPAIFDLFSLRAIKEKRQKPWKRIQPSTVIALYGSLVLIIFGTIIFYLLERDNSMVVHSSGGKIISSLFQSITPRTAGFNTVDFALVTPPALLLIIGLMLIGGSSGSTTGGIKTSTFVILLLSVYGIIKGKKNLEFGKRTISYEMLDTAYAIFLFAILIIFLSTFILTILQPQFNVLQIVFEVVSAFNTVGLSTGITPYLSTAGKTVIILTMFLGRVGILTIFFAMAKRVISTDYKYPKTNFMVG